jgi:hypothetical protein
MHRHLDWQLASCADLRRPADPPPMPAWPRRRPLDVDTLWRIERLGTPSLRPTARRRWRADPLSMDDNKGRSALWLLSTLGGAPRALTPAARRTASRAGARAATASPSPPSASSRAAKDDEPQLYVIAPDGGEAARAASVATGVEAFRWCPDGRRLLFVSWVWPELKGAKAQAKAHKAFKERKESGYATSEAQYRYWDHNLPMGREPHLHLLERRRQPADCATCSRARPTACRAPTPTPTSSTSRPTAGASSSPSTRRREAHGQLLRAGRDGAEERPRAPCSCRTPTGTSARPRYSPDGDRIAFVASTGALKHTMPDQLAVWDRESGPGRWSAPNGTTRCTPRCTGKTTARRCCSPPSSRAASTCGASTCPTGAPRWWSRRLGAGLRQGRRHAADAGRRGGPPAARLRAHLPGEPRAASSPSTTRCWPAWPAARGGLWITGAQGDRCRCG